MVDDQGVLNTGNTDSGTQSSPVGLPESFEAELKINGQVVKETMTKADALALIQQGKHYTQSMQALSEDRKKLQQKQYQVDQMIAELETLKEGQPAKAESEPPAGTQAAINIEALKRELRQEMKAELNQHQNIQLMTAKVQRFGETHRNLSVETFNELYSFATKHEMELEDAYEFLESKRIKGLPADKQREHYANLIPSGAPPQPTDPDAQLDDDIERYRKARGY